MIQIFGYTLLFLLSSYLFVSSFTLMGLFITGLVLILIDVFFILGFFGYADEIYSDQNRVSIGDGVMGPVFYLLIFILPITLIQFFLFLFIFIKNSPILFHFGYTISDLSLVIIFLELLLIGLIILFFKFVPNLKKLKISKYLYIKFMKRK